MRFDCGIGFGNLLENCYQFCRTWLKRVLEYGKMSTINAEEAIDLAEPDRV